jgi:Stigma-specific protein, Stig1
MRLPFARVLLASSLLSAACTSVPMRDRDAARDGDLMDQFVPETDVVQSPDVAAMPDTAMVPDTATVPDTSVAVDAARDVVSLPDAPLMCPAGQTACSGACVDTRTDLAHCGACAAACAPRANSTATCAASRCTYTCRPGFGDCDGNAANGCEASLDTTTNCGACRVACNSMNPICDLAMGRCVSGCSSGTRCGEICVDTTNTVTNCGSCGNVCPTPANAMPTCAASRCGFTCNAGFGDCDGNTANGCETNLSTSSLHCGRCGTTCSSAANGAGICSLGVCGLRCNAGFADCDRSAANGCEVDVNMSSTNCGACGRVCGPVAGGVGFCNAGACALSCNRDQLDCDRVYSTGCEVNVRNNPSNCGACGVNCGAAGICNLLSCVSCIAPRIPCSNACVDVTTDVNNCGACGYRCPAAPTGFTATCNAGICYYGSIGDPRMGDCDRSTANGYEINVDSSTSNCGRCGASCNALQRCCNGSCIPSGNMCAIL